MSGKRGRPRKISPQNLENVLATDTVLTEEIKARVASDVHIIANEAFVPAREGAGINKVESESAQALTLHQLLGQISDINQGRGNGN